MNWLSRSPEIACTCPKCGNEDNLLRGFTSRASRSSQGVRDTRSGKVYACPMCACQFIVTAAGVWAFGANSSRPQAPESAERKTREPYKYPPLDADISKLMEQQEP